LKAGDVTNLLTRQQVALLTRYRLLKPMLRQMAIADLTASVPVSAEEISEVMETFKREKRLGSDGALQMFLRRQLLQPQQLQQQLLEPRRLERYLMEHYLPKAEARFLQRKHQLDRVVYSLLRLDDQGLARELFLRVEEGEADFGALAARYAQGPERSTRGVVGPVPLAQTHPLLAERLRTSQPGIVLEPFALESWWLLARLESVMPARFDSAMAQQMARELFDEEVEQMVQRRIDRLIPLCFPAP